VANEREREKDLYEKLLGVGLCWMRGRVDIHSPSTLSSSCLTDAGVARSRPASTSFMAFRFEKTLLVLLPPNTD
jgi:hypothetical protein